MLDDLSIFPEFTVFILHSQHLQFFCLNFHPQEQFQQPGFTSQFIIYHGNLNTRKSECNKNTQIAGVSDLIE